MNAKSPEMTSMAGIFAGDGKTICEATSNGDVAILRKRLLQGEKLETMDRQGIILLYSCNERSYYRSGPFIVSVKCSVEP
jgi:hypothetical protein